MTPKKLVILTANKETRAYTVGTNDVTSIQYDNYLVSVFVKTDSGADGLIIHPWTIVESLICE